MAITYLAGNNIAGLASDRASLTTTYLLTGTTFLETDTDDMYHITGKIIPKMCQTKSNYTKMVIK